MNYFTTGVFYMDYIIVQAGGKGTRLGYLTGVSRFYEEMYAQLRYLGFDGQIVKLIDYNSRKCH